MNEEGKIIPKSYNGYKYSKEIVTLKERLNETIPYTFLYPNDRKILFDYIDYLENIIENEVGENILRITEVNNLNKKIDELRKSNNILIKVNKKQTIKIDKVIEKIQSILKYDDDEDIIQRIDINEDFIEIRDILKGDLT